MEIYENRIGRQRAHPWLLSLVILFLIVFGALLFTQGVALVLLPILFGIPLEELIPLMAGQSSHPNGRLAILFVQGIGGGGAFLLGGWLFMHLVDRKTMLLKQQFEAVKFNAIPVLIAVMAGFIMFNSLFLYLNMNVSFPESLAGLEKALREKEDELMKLTQFITDFENASEFIVGILVIGLIAGIGEEYLFRGILQPKMHHYTGNVHLGVWLTAIIFSAIHMQFYGFLPRMMLGALFGYLYVYSGSLVYPILAHILNNVFTVVMVYMGKLGIVEFTIGESSELHWRYVIFGLVIFVVGFRYFILLHHQPKPNG